MNILSLVYPMPFSKLHNDAFMWRIFSLRRVLEEAGHNVDLLYAGPRHLMTKEVEPELHTAFSLLPQIGELRVQKKGAYDVVLCNNVWTGFNSGLVNPIKDRRVLDIHGLPVEEYLIDKYHSRIRDRFLLQGYRAVAYISLNSCQEVVCVSRSMMRYVHERMKVPYDRMAYIPNGVDLQMYQPRCDGETARLKESLGLSGQMAFGYLGGSQMWQGRESFVSAAGLVKDRDVSFLIVGGEQSSTDGRVLIRPRVARDELPLYYSICDVLVLPRPHHIATEIAAPTKFAEYAAMGKPILTTNVGDAAEHVREYECGVVVRDNSPAALKEGIELMARMSPRELSAMGRKARDMARDLFDWDKLGKWYSDFLAR